MKLVGLLVITALTLSVVAGLNYCDSGRTSKPSMPDQKQNAEDKTEGRRNFREVSSGKGTTEDGAPFSTQLFESEKAERVYLLRENRDSAAAAEMHLQRRIRKAVEVIERRPNPGGGKGERIVARFAKSDLSEPDFVILWTEGKQLYSITTATLSVALEFEKKCCQAKP